MAIKGISSLGFSPGAALKALNIALSVGLALSVLLLMRDGATHFFGNNTEGPSLEQAAPKSSMQGGRRRVNIMIYAPLVEDSLFGFPAGRLTVLGSAPVQVQTSEPVNYDLNLKLYGTIAWSNGSGYAIMVNGSGEQELFKTGEDIPGAGKLLKVYADHIEVNVSGQTVVVAIEDDSISSVGRATSRRSSQAPSRAPVPRTRTAPAGPARVDYSKFARQTASNEYILNKDALESSLNNPKQIMTDARLLPYVKDGQQNGFVISEIRKEGLYENLGLQNGDVLIGVNSLKLSDPETALQAFTALRGMSDIELEILRNGVKSKLNYRIR